MTPFARCGWKESTDTFASTGLRDASGASGRYAGTQFDTRVRYWLKPDRFGSVPARRRWPRVSSFARHPGRRATATPASGIWKRPIVSDGGTLVGSTS